MALDWKTDSKSVLLSKTVWTASAGAIVAVSGALGYHIADAQVEQMIDLGLFLMAAVFRVTAAQPVHVVTPS